MFITEQCMNFMPSPPKLQAQRTFAIQITNIWGVVTPDYCLVGANKSKRIDFKFVIYTQLSQACTFSACFPRATSKNNRQLNNQECTDLTE